MLWTKVASALEELTHSCWKQPEPSYYFGDISQTKEFFRNYLEKIMINLNVTLKSIIGPDDTFKEISRHEWDNMACVMAYK